MLSTSLLQFHLADSASAFAITCGLVALAEIGDKTQLLTLLLVARYRRPWPILAGMLAATLANHTAAAALGIVVEGLLTPEILRWVLSASFAGMAIWTLIPDKLEEDSIRPSRFGAFLSTLVLFFLAEIGDKTQLATTALAARYGSILLVTAASSLGLMLANIPVLLLGDKLMRRLPLKVVRYLAAAAFAALAVAAILAV